MLNMANKKTESNRTGKPVNAWIRADLHAALESWRKGERPRPTITSIIETALEDFLISKGAYEPTDTDEDE
jgi:hypothetical protein